MAVSQRMWKREQERKRRERLKRERRRRNCALLVVLLAILAVVVVVLIKTGKNDDHEKISATPPPDVYIDHRAVSDPYTTTREIDDIKTSFFRESAFAGNALAQTIGMYGILEDADIYANVNVDVENVYEITPDGSTTAIAEQFKSKRFNKIFLAFGENELSRFRAGEFKEHYKKLVGKIKEYQPETTIYLIGIPPITSEASNLEVNGMNIKKIKEFNKRIISIAVDEKIYYVNSIDALGDNKDFLPKGVSADGVNLNKAAVLDLIYYIQKEAYIPDSEDLAELDIEEDDEEADTENTVPSEPLKTTQAPAPSPTVNVFKDSVQEKKKGE